MSETANNPTIDNLVQSSLEIGYQFLGLEWIPQSQITGTEPTQSDNVYYAIRKQTQNNGTVDETTIMLLLLGSNETCTPTLVSEFARIYSLPTHKYSNDVSQFRRYSKWLERCNKFIKGIAKYEDKDYMIADELFYYCYSRYRFCTTCLILRCS